MVHIVIYVMGNYWVKSMFGGVIDGVLWLCSLLCFLVWLSILLLTPIPGSTVALVGS